MEGRKVDGDQNTEGDLLGSHSMRGLSTFVRHAVMERLTQSLKVRCALLTNC